LKGLTLRLDGDLAFCRADKAVHYMNRLNGSKILITGNHDAKLVRNHPEFLACFESTHNYLEIGYKDHRIVMFHFPIWEWDRMHHGAIHFHGHCHGRKTGIPGRIIDVSMDGNNCIPYTMDEAVAKALYFPVRGR